MERQPLCGGIVARDRSRLHADGSATGAPQAQQAADGFHLILNLSTATAGVLEAHSGELVLPAEADPPALEPATTSQDGHRIRVPQLRQQQRRQRRLERYESVMDPDRRGFSQSAISREPSIGVKTVRRWLRADQFPERRTPSGRRKKVAEFEAYLGERWKQGCHNSVQLFAEIRARGYRGSRQMVSAFVASWRQTGGKRAYATAPQRIDAKHAAILADKPPDDLTPKQKTPFDCLVGC